MTAPIFFFAACFAAAVVVLAHFIVMREPPGERLPTARFVPVGPSIVRSLTTAPTDWSILATRVAAILLIGLAFARPHAPHRRVPLVTIVVVDRSSAVQDAREAADSARTILEAIGTTADRTAAGALVAVPHTPNPRPQTPASASVLITFDSAATVIPSGSLEDTLIRLERSDAPGSLTLAFVTALRTASRWRIDADSLALTVVSPVRADEVDAALRPVRALWPGNVRLVRIAARAPTPQGPGRPPSIDWPVDGHAAQATQRRVIDTVGALVVGDVVVARSFQRRWMPDTTGARIIGRWADGAPAIVERGTAAGCVRGVTAAVDTGRGLVRDPEWPRLVRELHAPCGASVGVATPALPADLWPSGGGNLHVASAAFRSMPLESNRLSIALLVLALVALAMEMGLRSRRGALRAV